MTRRFAQNPPLQTKQQSYDVTEQLKVSEHHLEMSLPQFGQFCETPHVCNGFMSLFQALSCSSRDDAWVTRQLKARENMSACTSSPQFPPVSFSRSRFQVLNFADPIISEPGTGYGCIWILMPPSQARSSRINSTRYSYVGSSSLELYRAYSSWRKISLWIRSPLISLSGVREFR